MKQKQNLASNYQRFFSLRSLCASAIKIHLKLNSHTATSTLDFNLHKTDVYNVCDLSTTIYLALKTSSVDSCQNEQI